MAIARVASVLTGVGRNGGTSASIDSTGANLIVVGVAWLATSSQTLSDSKGNTWTALTLPSGTSNDPNTRLYYCSSPTVGTGHTFTITGTNVYSTLWAIAYSGAETSSVLDAQNSASDNFSPTTLGSGSVTPSADGAVVVSGLATFINATNPTVSGGAISRLGFLNAVANQTYTVSYADEIQTTATARTATWSWTTGNRAVATIAAFKAAAAGSGVTGPVGLATETDLALALAPGAAVGAVGLASETDTAFARAALQLRAVGLASETDAALALAGRLIRPAGLAAEADTAFALDPGAQPGIVGTASETDTALPLAGRAIRPTGLATEADAALALVARGLAPVGLAAETDTAFALFASGPQPVGLAVETDQALALAGSGGQIISLGGRRGGGRAERERRERIAAEVDQLTKDELREVSAMLLAIFETEVFHG